MNASARYALKLKDPRWQRIRLKVLERDNFQCMDCGCKLTELHVHHKYYAKGVEPWDYPLDIFQTLCKDCHHERTEAIRDINMALAEMPTAFLECLSFAINGAVAIGHESRFQSELMSVLSRFDMPEFGVFDLLHSYQNRMNNRKAQENINATTQSGPENSGHT